jgi:hypothetical protein
MSVDNLGTAMALTLAVLAATTGVLSSNLFVTPNRSRQPTGTDVVEASCDRKS